MPTIVHTMLVRVGSMVCSVRVGSASAGAAASGSAEVASVRPEPALALRPLAVLRSWFRAPLLTIVARSTGHSANQTTRYCSGQQPPGPGFISEVTCWHAACARAAAVG